MHDSRVKVRQRRHLVRWQKARLKIKTNPIEYFTSETYVDYVDSPCNYTSTTYVDYVDNPCNYT